MRRELIEEAAYEARTVEFLSRGPTSPGMTDKVIALALATGLRQVGPGGGIGGESIVLHVVPLEEVDARILPIGSVPRSRLASFRTPN